MSPNTGGPCLRSKRSTRGEAVLRLETSPSPLVGEGWGGGGAAGGGGDPHAQKAHISHNPAPRHAGARCLRVAGGRCRHPEPVPYPATGGDRHPHASHLYTPTTTPEPTLTPTPAPSATPTPLFTESTRRETRGSVTLITTTRQTEYFIHGLTGEELDREMRTVGPTDASAGLHWHALTEPHFNWDRTCTCTDAGCTAREVTMYLTVDYWLPLWVAPDEAADDLVWSWQAFREALAEHEYGHGNLAAACAWSLGETFVALPPAPNCDALDAAMLSAAQPVFAACRAEQRGYENATNHGRTQGVLWPPGGG